MGGHFRGALFPAGVVIGGPHCCVAVGAVIPCAHRGGSSVTGRVGWPSRRTGVGAKHLGPARLDGTDGVL